MAVVDKAWFDMDTNVNLMVINGVMLFEGTPDWETLLALLNEQLVVRYERFREKVVDGGSGRLSWETDPSFDIRSHVMRLALPAPANLTTLQEMVSSLASEPLDPRRPLWRFYLVENVHLEHSQTGMAAKRAKGNGSALIGRIHHSIGDGIALIRVLLSLTAATPAASLALIEHEVPQRPHLSPIEAMARQMGKRILTVRSLAESAAGEIAQSMENPGRLVELARSASLLSMTSAAILARLVILPADRPSVFRGPLSAIKKTVWSEPLGLERIKQIGKASGATINDVLVAVVAGGLRRYMASQGDNPDAGDITVTVPVNLRPAHKAHELGNQFALVYLQLPLSESRPLERLRLTKKRMDALKNSPEPMVVYQLLSAMGILPNELSTLARNFFSAKATAVLTNVPGPREQLYLAGKPLAQLIFWVPQSGDIGLGISIISYKGQVTIGLMVDEQLIAHPQRIVEQVEDEIALLEAELLSQ